MELARNGASVLVVEAAETIGGGTRTAELTLPGYHHDVCSAAHPLGILSPYLSTLPLAEHGLAWIQPSASVAHPLDGAPAVILRKSLDTTAGLARTGRRGVSQARSARSSTIRTRSSRRSWALRICPATRCSSLASARLR